MENTDLPCVQTAALLSKPGMRPAEVGQWIKYGRSTTRATIVEDQEKLVKKWWEWWISLAPAWHKKDDTGRPTIGQESGDWGALIHPGTNGMLTVLLPLVWWKLGEEGEEGDVASDDWVTAVRDVSWVLQGLLSAAKSRYAPISHALITNRHSCSTQET